MAFILHVQILLQMNLFFKNFVSYPTANIVIAIVGCYTDRDFYMQFLKEMAFNICQAFIILYLSMYIIISSVFFCLTSEHLYNR